MMKSRNPFFSPHFWPTLVTLIIVLTFLLPPFYGCGTKREFLVSQMVKASEGATISSSDHRITLEIPPDALSEDTTLTLSIMPEAEWTDDIQAIEPLGSVYRLEPDGLELGKPAMLTIRLEPDDLAGLDLPEGAFPACIVLTRSNNGEWDMLHNPVTTIDNDTSEVLITGEATHFSDAIVRKTDMAVAINPSSVQKRVEETWPATVTIFNLSDIELDVWTIYYKCMGEVFVESQYYVQGFHLDSGESRTSKPPPLYVCSALPGTGKYGARITASPAFTWSGLPAGMLRLFMGTLREKTEQSIVEIVVWGSATCGKPVATPAPVSEGTPEEPEEQVACGLTFNPDLCEFGDVCVGDSKKIKVTVTNPCDFNVTVADYRWPDAPFKVVSTVPRNLTLAKGQSYEYTIEFTPPSTGEYTGYFGIGFEFEYGGNWDYRVSLLEVSGTGVACEQQASAISIEGEPSCSPTTEGPRIYFPLKVRDLTNGNAKIKQVVVYLNGVEDVNSGAISSVEYPPTSSKALTGILSLGTHTVTVVATNALGQTVEKTWEVFCGEESVEPPPSFQRPEPGICPFCGKPFDQCTCPK